ncbi:MULTISPECIES: hypothetical protein [unclassified Caballeronia]|uniref:hypothetical protein n=1 Tax=unclassified Caballeronia TaxID=2646786 RepID=UPI00158DF8B2|nr:MULTISPECIES: hypothetical protein [unclassified Caballeronia]QSN65156.1 hypothetical protein JYK05_24780 [Caballeronia sp. M1242]
MSDVFVLAKALSVIKQKVSGPKGVDQKHALHTGEGNEHETCSRSLGGSEGGSSAGVFELATGSVFYRELHDACCMPHKECKESTEAGA